MTNRPTDPAVKRQLLQILRITSTAWGVPMPSLLVHTGTVSVSVSASAQGRFVHRANSCQPVNCLRWAT